MMLYRAEDLRKLEVKAIDGEIGTIRDLYFDDQSWSIRYLVVQTGGWLLGREVLISKDALQGSAPSDSAFVTQLTRKQIEESPSVDTDKPVSRQMEAQLSHYYGWVPYWAAPFGLTPWFGLYNYPPVPEPFDRQDSASQQQRDMAPMPGDPHLRSFLEVKTYALHASDGDIGEVEDFLIEAGSWRITHLIADANTWRPGGHVVIDRGLMQEISWADKTIAVNMSRSEVKNAPAFDKHQPISEDWQRRISDYYRTHFGNRVPRHSVSEYQALRSQDPGLSP